MRTQYLHKITSNLGNIFRKIVSKMNFPFLYKASILAGYLFVCALVLVPQIDYQDWYPEQFGTFDYELSQDFSEHKKLTLEVDDRNNIPKVLEILHTRYTELGVYKIKMETEDKNIIVHLPSTLSNEIIALSIGKGDVTLNTRTEESSTDYTYEVLYDPSNYIEADVDLSKITNAKIVEDDGTYTAIEITSSEEEKWNALSDNISSTTLGLFVDGEIYLSQIVPKSESVPKPRLVIYSSGQNISLIVSELKNEPLTGIIDASLDDVEPIYSSDFSTIFLIITLLSIATGLIFRLYIVKDFNRNISQTLLIIIGILTVSKIIPITWGLLELLTLSTLLIVLLITQTKDLLKISILILPMGIIINQFTNNYLVDAGKLIYVSGIYSLVIYLLLFFTGIYEEKK